MSAMHDSDGVKPIEVRPTLRNGRIWVKPLLFLLFVIGFILTSPEPRQPFQFNLDPNIIDQGAGWLFSLWMKFLGRWNPDQMVSGGDYLTFLGLVLSFFSWLMLLPKVPLTVTVGGQITLFGIWLVFGEPCLEHHGVEAWNVCLGAMLIAQLGLWKGTRWNFFVVAAYGVTLGFFPLMRRPAVQTPLACCFILGILGLAAAASGFLRWRNNRRRSEEAGRVCSENPPPNADGYASSPDWSFLQYLKPLAVFFVCFLVMRTGASWVWSSTNHATMRPHPAGYSLIQSLGFGRNAYNAVWGDEYALTQGLLYEGRPWRDDDSRADEKLMALWRKRVLEDPGMVMRGAFAKAVYLVRYFTGTLNPLATQEDGYPTKPSWITMLMGIGCFVGATVCAVMFCRHRNDRMLILAAGTAGLGIAAFAQLVIVVPFYPGCAIAYCLGIFLILLPAVRHVAMEARTENAGFRRLRNTLVYRVVGILALMLLLLVSGFTGYRSVVNRAKARELLAGDPFEKLNQLRLDFAFRFNRLSLPEQQNMIMRLLSAPVSQPVFRLPTHPASEAPKLFSPVLAISGDRFLCVVAKLSRDWKMLLPSRGQGPKNSVLLVVKNGDRLRSSLDFLESPDQYLKIADANWDGRYRMFVLPAPADYAADARFLGVSAFNFKAGVEVETLVLDLIAGDRLYRSDQLPR